MEIKKMNLQNLRNEEHFQLMTDVKALIQATNLAVLNIDPIIRTFMDKLDSEDKGIEAIRKSSITVSIVDADSHRDDIYRGFVLYTKAFSYNIHAEKAQAAHNIQIIIDHYGDFREKSYNEETASIYNFLQDLNDRCANDITILGATEWISGLSAANQTFSDLMNQRYDENLGQTAINLHETRKNIDSAYSQIIDRVNAFILLNGDADYYEFVERLNNRISYFKNTLIQRKGRAAAKKETPAVSQ